MRIFIYSRKSVYTGKGESIENQIEMCRRYIENRIDGGRGAEIAVYEDEGFSGRSLNRPQFQKMLEDAKKHKPDIIVCYRLDRISRSVGDFAPLVEDLIARNIGFISIKEQFDTSTPMGKAMMYIASVFAQLERETIAERVRDHMLMLARSGRWLGGTPPTGFLSEKVEEVVVDGKIKTSCKLKWNPDEIETVRTIYEKFLETHSVSGVLKYLMRSGVRSRTGRFYSLPGIRDILSNPVYCAAGLPARDYFLKQGSDVCFSEEACSDKLGLLSYNKRDYSRKGAPRLQKSEWIIAVGKHKGIIRASDWVAVQNILDANKPQRRRRNMHNGYALLSGALICKQCGARMFAKPRSNGKGLFDYICENKLHGGVSICGCQNLSGQQTDDLVCRSLLDYAKGDFGVGDLLKQLRPKILAENQDDKIESVKRKIQITEIQLDQLLATIIQPELTPALARRAGDRAQELDRQLAELKAEMERLQSEERRQAESELRLDWTVHLLTHLKESFETLSIYEKRELARLLIQRAEWDGENLDLFLYGG